MKAIHVKDLKDQTGMDGPRPFLKCFKCGMEYNANRLDYFDVSPERIFKHCGRNMALVIKRTVYEVCE